MKNVRFYYSPALRQATHSVLINPRTGEVTATGYLKNPKDFPRLTICGVFDSENGVLSFGVACCAPQDQFVKRTGRAIAEDRARNNPYKKIILMEDELSDLTELFVSHAALISAQLLGV
jgi:hypothetical protein